MKRCAALFFLGLLAGGASAAETGAVRVFEAGELTLDRYTVVERLWTGTWRAAFWLPSRDNAGAAIAALTSEAGRLGADGVTNLHCLQDGGGLNGGYVCYGLAIKLK
jgi:hypothetical protein